MRVLERLDDLTQSQARELANTHSRRSFLAGVARGAVALTGVGILETAIATPALAHHTCAHTGTSPTCNNNPWPNCNGSQVEGGCWNACGCCGDLLKTLCDCCVPRCGGCSTCSCCGQAHGYCPSGYCVKCIHFRCTQAIC
jgi:hypothetical protein